MTARAAHGIALLLAFGIAAGSPVRAEATGAGAARPACAPHAAEAARRSRLSEAVILRVMHVESRGRANAMSPKGAMGCMQIMPRTWRDLSARYRLGSDPWNARFNMIGGALYLAELARQFGFPGAYAAYNAGPARYARHVRSAVPLPAETRAYMASLSGAAPARGGDDGRVAPPPRWQDAGLFPRAEPVRVARADGATPVPASASAKTSNGPVANSKGADRSGRGELFPLARAQSDRMDDGGDAE